MLACTLCAGRLVFAQEPAYNWGEPATNDFSERQIDKLLALDNGGFVLLRKYTDPTFTNSYWLEYYSTELKNSSSVDEYGSFVYTLKEDRLYVLWNNTRLSVPSIPAANWTEPDGTKYVKHKAFDEKTMHASFMQVIEPDGFLAYENRKFGLPLFELHDGAVFEMSLTSPFFFTSNGNLVVMASMHNGGKRYRFGIVGL